MASTNFPYRSEATTEEISEPLATKDERPEDVISRILGYRLVPQTVRRPEDE
jgi:hypothetical protein